jgi:hypothetical protein
LYYYYWVDAFAGIPLVPADVIKSVCTILNQETNSFTFFM